jgi:hypothetical protein
MWQAPRFDVTPGSEHRPPTRLRVSNYFITLRVEWYGRKPTSLVWSIGTAANPVSPVPDIPRRFEQHLQYDPNQSYGIRAVGVGHMTCEVYVDTGMLDDDDLPAGVTGDVHCWVDALI